MNLKNLWSGNVSFKGAVLVALVSLVVGLGISGSLDWLAPSRARQFHRRAGIPTPLAERLAGFCHLWPRK